MVRVTLESGTLVQGAFRVRVQLLLHATCTLLSPLSPQVDNSPLRLGKLSPLTSIDVTMYRVCPLYLLIIEFHFVQKVSNLIHVETHFID